MQLPPIVLGLPLLAASGDEIVLALRRAGFRLAWRSQHDTGLTDGYRDIVVPNGFVRSDTLVGLLRSAGISYPRFLELLETLPTPDPRLESQVRARTVPKRDDDD